MLSANMMIVALRICISSELAAPRHQAPLCRPPLTGPWCRRDVQASYRRLEPVAPNWVSGDPGRLTGADSRHHGATDNESLYCATKLASEALALHRLRRPGAPGERLPAPPRSGASRQCERWCCFGNLVAATQPVVR